MTEWILFGMLASLNFCLICFRLKTDWKNSDKQRYQRALKLEQNPLQTTLECRSCGHFYSAQPRIGYRDTCDICFYEMMNPEAKNKREAKAAAGALSFSTDQASEGSLTLTEEKK